MIGENLKADDLTDDAHVVRYVKPRKLLEDGSVDGSEFRLRPDDSGLSVNWLECFRDRSKDEQLTEVRRLSRLDMRPTGCLAELNVGATKRHVQNGYAVLLFVHKPLVANCKYEADPSHSEILGLPPGDSPQAAMIGDMIAECVRATYPTVAE